MKFGLKLHHSGPGARPEHMLEWTRFAEALGIHIVMTADHVALTPDVIAQYPDPYYEPFTSIAWLAGQTKRIEFGTTIIVVPYRHAIELANLTASIDRLSGGRFIFGVGVGWARSEFEALGVRFEERGAMTNDYLAAIKALWTQDVASHDGPYVSFRDVKLSPKPVQTPHPPIWVGGNADQGSSAGMRRAVRFGSAWHPLGIRVDHMRDTALPKLKRIADEERLPVPDFCPRIFCRLTDRPLPDETRVAGEGTLDQVRGDLEALQELGARYVVFDTKRNSPTASSPDHYREAWRTLTILAEKAVDLDKESVR